jgi:hypothetical protein
MTNTTQKRVPVKIYSVVTTGYTCTDPESVHEKHVDVFFPNSEDNGDREDLGCDAQHISVDGKGEMVFVDKDFLIGLIEQNQRLSSNENVYDDKNRKSFAYADLDDLVLGMTFADEVKTHGSEVDTIEVDRKIMAENILSGHDFIIGLVTDVDSWKVDGNTWVMKVYLEDPDGVKATSDLTIKFQDDRTNVDSVSSNLMYS